MKIENYILIFISIFVAQLSGKILFHEEDNYVNDAPAVRKERVSNGEYDFQDLQNDISDNLLWKKIVNLAHENAEENEILEEANSRFKAEEKYMFNNKEGSPENFGGLKMEPKEIRENKADEELLNYFDNDCSFDFYPYIPNNYVLSTKSHLDDNQLPDKTKEEAYFIPSEIGDIQNGKQNEPASSNQENISDSDVENSAPKDMYETENLVMKALALSKNYELNQSPIKGESFSMHNSTENVTVSKTESALLPSKVDIYTNNVSSGGLEEVNNQYPVQNSNKSYYCGCNSSTDFDLHPEVQNASNSTENYSMNGTTLAELESSDGPSIYIYYSEDGTDDTEDEGSAETQGETYFVDFMLELLLDVLISFLDLFVNLSEQSGLLLQQHNQVETTEEIQPLENDDYDETSSISITQNVTDNGIKETRIYSKVISEAPKSDQQQLSKEDDGKIIPMNISETQNVTDSELEESKIDSKLISDVTKTDQQEFNKEDNIETNHLNTSDSENNTPDTNEDLDTGSQDNIRVYYSIDTIPDEKYSPENDIYPSYATFNGDNSENWNKDDDEVNNEGFFSRLWNWIKSLFY